MKNNRTNIYFSAAIIFVLSLSALSLHAQETREWGTWGDRVGIYTINDLQEGGR